MVIDQLEPHTCTWLNSPALTAIFSALAAAGGEARVVGGAVRDTVLGRPIGDIDLAVNLLPNQVIAALGKQGIKTVPTGISHGTVTAVYDHKGYEITTLRHDVSPDGRHTKVAFTGDWCADAARRDFTVNGLYLDANGVLYDCFDGLTDIKERVIRFIGDPYERIREDVLRILRAYRFMAQLEGFTIHEAGLKACEELAPLLSTLSAERVWKEISRLLVSPCVLAALKLMKAGGVLSAMLLEAQRIDRLEKLLLVEPAGTPPCPIRRLAALIETPSLLVAEKLRLSKANARGLAVLQESLSHWEPVRDIKKLRQLLYDHGATLVRDAILLREAGGLEPLRTEWLDHISTWIRPVFPLTGKELKKSGFVEGPDMGRALAQTERWWREQDFMPDKMACLNKALEKKR